MKGEQELKFEAQLHELECMAEFAAELALDLNPSKERPGLCEIEMSKGDRLSFCCFDMKRRIEELQDILTCA